MARGARKDEQPVSSKPRHGTLEGAARLEGTTEKEGTHRDGLNFAIRKLVLARRPLQRVPRVDVRVLVLLN